MEFLLLATGARRANLASELFSAAKIATVMAQIRWAKPAGLSRIFLARELGPGAAVPAPALCQI
jgi:hypothetical protein